MNGIKHRLYSDPADLEAMLDLLVRLRPGERITDFPSPADLREALSLPAVQQNTRLWLDEQGQLRAFAYVDPYHNLRFELDQSAATPQVEAEIVAWGEACLREVVQTGGDPLTLDGSCREDDQARIAFFERHGFERQPERSLHLERRLDEPLPAPELPPGFAIRPVSGDEEAPALVELHRAAFGSAMMTVAERLAMMRGPDYERELDLVVVAPDGRLAAYCFCWISAEENLRSGRKMGYTDPLATHPDFQRRGLAQALLLDGMRKLKARGMETAALGTSSTNLAMQAAAQAVGFRVKAVTLWFAKQVGKIRHSYYP